MEKIVILANFGGPRCEKELTPFLIELLTDPDVIQTSLPSFLQKWLFTRVAKKRAKIMKEEYQKMGGRSPLFQDTNRLAFLLQETLGIEVVAFHRYLPATHLDFFAKIERKNPATVQVLPLFPQFSYSTTGSIARLFSKKFSTNIQEKLAWIPSYATHPGYIQAEVNLIQSFLEEHNLSCKDTFLLFSCHGLPKEYVEQGDPYESQCLSSFEEIMRFFPEFSGTVSYQSQFGKKEWLRPYTEDFCKNPSSYLKGQKNVVVIPLSFTSDHLETLVEIEEQYIPLLKKQHLFAYRCPALNFSKTWIKTLPLLLQDGLFEKNETLIRKKKSWAYQN